MNALSKVPTVICQKYNITERNWTDIILFMNYYLVSVQKKVPSLGDNEYLNKYDKETGQLKWSMSLQEAGKLCKINEEGLVAALQIGGINRSIAVIDSSKHSFFGGTFGLRVLYRWKCLRPILHTAV